MAYITKIEVYPQIFFYDKVYLDERLNNLGIKENKGRFFGAIIKEGTATFTDAAINPLAPIDNYLKFDIFAGENYSPSIDIDLIYQQFLEKFLLLPEIQTAIGIKYYILDDVESEHWKEIRITGIDGELFYVVPSPSNINVLLPIRVRFFYRITYKSGEQEILLSFPQQANGFYETVLNADRPYQFLPDTDKEYAPNEWQVFDIDGKEMFRGEGENPTPYNITANSNGAYVLLKESIIGCYDNELMRQKAMVDSRVFLGQTVLDEVKADSRLPASIQELLIHDWTFAYRDEDQKTTTGQNVYDVKSSFIRRRCYFVPYNTTGASVIMAKFIDARTSEEYPINGLDRIALTFSSVEPMIIMDDTITSLSDVIHSIKAKIDCSGTIEDFTAVERTVNLHLYKLDTGDRWSTQSVTNPPEPVTIGNIEHGGNKIDTIFERLSREDLEEMCGLPANSTHAWLGNVVVSYTGTFNGNPLTTIMQSFDFMLGIDKCISISGASLAVSGGIWRSTSLEVLIEMPSITPAFIKNRILGELFIPVNGLFLRYAGTLAGQIVGSASPARYFKAPSASVYYGTNTAKISFTGNNAIYNAIGSPITLVNGTVFLFVTVRDGQANGIDVPYNVEIPVTGGDLNYTVSNPPDITEVDPKIETLISQV